MTYYLINNSDQITKGYHTIYYWGTNFSDQYVFHDVEYIFLFFEKGTHLHVVHCSDPKIHIYIDDPAINLYYAEDIDAGPCYPLHTVEMIQYLLDHEAKFDFGILANWALKENDMIVFQYLVDIYQPTSWKFTGFLVTIAFWYERYEFAKILISRGASIEEKRCATIEEHRQRMGKEYSPLSISIRRNQLEMIEYLLSLGAHTNSDAMDYLLLNFIEDNNLDRIKYIINLGYDISQSTFNFLKSRVCRKHPEIIPFLIGLGWNYRPHLVKIIIRISSDVMVETMQYLINLDPTVLSEIIPSQEIFGRRDLFNNINHDNLVILVENGLVFKDREASIWRPLSNRYDKESVSIMNLLIANGSCFDPYLNDMLVNACSRNAQMTIYLLSLGADIHYQNEYALNRIMSDPILLREQLSNGFDISHYDKLIIREVVDRSCQTDKIMTVLGSCYPGFF